MLVRTIFSSIAIATIARADNQNHNAPIATNNPEGAAFVAMLPNRQDTTIRGNITAITASDGKGVQFALDIEGLPMEGGPFPYHIHDQPVPPDGNCTGTLAHLDPFGRGEMPPCDGTSPATCQVGDLAGKHGMLEAPTYADSYKELYTSLQQGKGAFFGNRSITIHFSNTTRITCANFTEISPGEGMIGQQPMAQSAAPGSVIPLPTLTESAVGGTPTQSGLSQPNPASPPPPGGSPGAAGFNGTMTTGTLPLSGQAFPTPTTSTSTSTSTLGVASAASQASGTVSASPEQFTGAASREDVGLFGVGVGALAAVAAMGMM